VGRGLPAQLRAEREEILKSVESQEKQGETNKATAPDTNAAPFRIQDYGQTAVQLESASRQLTELIHALDQTLASTNLAKLSAQVGPVVQQAETSGRALVDYAFWKGALLVGIVFAAALIYRLLGARLVPLKR
jgi:hypothetical protein